MRIQVNKRILSAAAAAALFMSCGSYKSFAESARLDTNNITISDVNELREFAENCSIDSWSRGKTVTLTADIELKGAESTPIPIFCGKFIGGGHTVSGLRISADGSNAGLFRYIESSAEVEGLNVNGVITPGGSAAAIGGIAGVNSGAIRDCSFTGSVIGKENIGGIVGINKESGVISGCNTMGGVHGKSSTGGIVGSNSGLIFSSENKSNVNTTASDSEMPSFSDIDTDVEDIISMDGGDNSDSDTFNNCSDTGGVAGFSDGVIQACSNIGTIGYPHVGYNTGGIAGRQSGYIAGCTNGARIYGRKEVGGIVGQSEPYMELLPNNDMLTELQAELDVLNELVDSSLDDSRDIGDTATSHLNNIRSYTNNAKDSTQSIADGLSDFANDNINSVNLLTADLSNSMEKAKLAADDFGRMGETVSDIADGLKNTVDTLAELTDIGDIAMDDFDDALAALQSCADDIGYASSDLEKAIEMIQTESAENASADLSEGMRELGIAVDEMDKAFAHISDLADTLQKAVEDIIHVIYKDDNIIDGQDSSFDIGDISDAFSGGLSDVIGDLTHDDISETLSSIADEVSGDLDSISGIVDDASNSIKVERDRIHNDVSGLTKALKSSVDAFGDFAGELSVLSRDLDHSLDSVKSAVSALTAAADDFSGAAGEFRSVVKDMDPASDIVNTAVGYMDNVMDNLSKAGNILEEACDNIGDAVDIIANRDPSPFVPLSSDIHKQSDNLFDSVDLISAEAQNLTDDLNSDYNHTVDNLQVINAQVKKIYDIAISDAEDLLDGDGYNVEDIIQDTSDENISGTREGRVTNCSNSGSVDGDRNVGGIIGAMAVEHDLDPEDDIQDNISVRSKFETRAVLDDCVNYGSVNAKTDSSGGIVGRMELGTATDCGNYGEVSGADYVGGITGRTRATVRRCFEKSTLSGQRYIGGIAGYAGTVKDCYSIINITEGNEFIGAIAGSADSGDVVNNRFIDTGINGIDNISYEKSAAPISFEELEKLSGIPTKFIEFEMTFKSDGRQCGAIKFNYGDDLSRVDLPEVPEKDGYYGEWEKFDTSGKMSDITVNALYTPIITIISSEETNDKIACALVSGKFSGNAVLHAETADEAPPAEAGEHTSIYHITLEGSDYTSSDYVPLRLLIPNKSSASVWQLVNGEWQTVKAQKNGQYMMLDMLGTEGTFCISSISRNEIPIISAAVGAIVLLAVIISVVKVWKKHKAKNTVSNK